jgi:undecaprenyl-diphosphatase
MMFLKYVCSNPVLNGLFRLWLYYLVLALLASFLVPDIQSIRWIHQQTWVQAHIESLNFLSNQLLYGAYLIFFCLLCYALIVRNIRLYTIAIAYWLAQLIGSGFIVNIAKFLFGHARPSQLWTQLPTVKDLWIGPTMHYSYHGFPSGHSCDYLVSAIFIAWLANRPWLSVIAILFAIFQGALRVMLAKHFPVDVFGGVVVGGIVSFGLIGYAAKNGFYCVWKKT